MVQLINDPSDDFNPADANYTKLNGDYQKPANNYQSPDGNYSSSSSDYQTPGTDYQSPNNAYESSPENNQSIPNPTKRIYIPIVGTFPPHHDGNGTYRLGGRILTDGGSSPFEVGIVLSESITLSNSVRITSLPDQNSSTFHVSYADLFPGKTYYFRAYAINSAGQNRGKSKRNLETNKRPLRIAGTGILKNYQPVGKNLIGWVPFVPPNINGFTMRKWNGSTPPRWKMAASGYGTKQMDGAGLKQGYIHTYTVGETPLGFIYREKSMA